MGQNAYDRNWHSFAFDVSCLRSELYLKKYNNYKNRKIKSKCSIHVPTFKVCKQPLKIYGYLIIEYKKEK